MAEAEEAEQQPTSAAKTEPSRRLCTCALLHSFVGAGEEPAVAEAEEAEQQPSEPSVRSAAETDTLRLRGLPFTAGPEDIQQFFAGASLRNSCVPACSKLLRVGRPDTATLSAQAGLHITWAWHGADHRARVREPAESQLHLLAAGFQG